MKACVDQFYASQYAQTNEMEDHRSDQRPAPIPVAGNLVLEDFSAAIQNMWRLRHLKERHIFSNMFSCMSTMHFWCSLVGYLFLPPIVYGLEGSPTRVRSACILVVR